MVLLLSTTAAGAPEVLRSARERFGEPILRVSAFMAATGALVPMETAPAGEAPGVAPLVESPTRKLLGGYVHFAFDPRVPTALLLDLEVPAETEKSLVRVSIQEGKAHPVVRWVPVPAVPRSSRLSSVHVPVWVDELTFCQDVVIEIASGEKREAILRRVIRFVCSD